VLGGGGGACWDRGDQAAAGLLWLVLCDADGCGGRPLLRQCVTCCALLHRTRVHNNAQVESWLFADGTQTALLTFQACSKLPETGECAALSV
jgi:hypothetical protein